MLAAKGIAVDGCVFQPEREGCDDILVKTLTMNIRDLHFFFFFFLTAAFYRAELQVLAHSLSFNTWRNQPIQSEIY